MKEQIFGLNAARVFGVDVNAKRNELPKDYLSQMKMAYLDEGPRAEPPLLRLDRLGVRSYIRHFRSGST